MDGSRFGLHMHRCLVSTYSAWLIITSVLFPHFHFSQDDQSGNHCSINLYEEWLLGLAQVCPKGRAIIDVHMRLRATYRTCVPSSSSLTTCRAARSLFYRLHVVSSTSDVSWILMQHAFPFAIRGSRGPPRTLYDEVICTSRSPNICNNMLHVIGPHASMPVKIIVSDHLTIIRRIHRSFRAGYHI